MPTKLFDLIPSWVYAAAVALLSTLLFLQWSTSNVEIQRQKMAVLAEQKKHSDYVAEQLKINTKAKDEARQREQDLQAQADKDRHESQTRINRLRTERDAALAKLRDHPQRPASANGIVLPSPAGSGSQASGCTGAELYREDAEAALGIGFDAEELRLEYNKLWSLYERARAQTPQAVKQ